MLFFFFFAVLRQVSFLILFSFLIYFQFLFARQLMLGFLVALVSGVVIALVVLIAIADGEGGHQHEH